MLAAEVVCCIWLPNITGEFRYTSKKCGHRTDCSYRSSLIWEHTVCHWGLFTFQQTRKADDFCCDWPFRDQNIWPWPWDNGAKFISWFTNPLTFFFSGKVKKKSEILFLFYPLTLNIICFVQKNSIFLRFCLCIFESDTAKSDCSIKIFRKIMKYLIFNTDCWFTLVGLLFVLEIFKKKKKSSEKDQSTSFS